MNRAEAAEFHIAYDAHRAYYQHFGDTYPVTALDVVALDTLGVPDEDMKKFKELIIERQQMYEHIVLNAYPYTIAVTRDGSLISLEGHKINHQYFEAGVSMCRGMFVRMGGKHDGTVILQMDAGVSRSLFDEKLQYSKKEFMNIILNALLLGPSIRGKFSDSGTSTSTTPHAGGRIYDRTVVFMDAQLSEIYSHSVYGLTYNSTGDAAAWLHPTVTNLPYVIEGL